METKEAMLPTRTELNAIQCMGKIFLAIVIAVAWTTVFVQLVPMSNLSSLQASAIQVFLLGMVVAPAVHYFLLIPIRLQTMQEEKDFLALYDSLTGLPRRNLLHELLSYEISIAERDVYRLAAIIVEPADVSEINHALGYDYGDDIIRQCASRLTTTATQPNLIARLEAGAFALIFSHIDTRVMGEVEKQLKRVFDKPFALQGSSLNVGCNMGIAIFPEHADNADLLLQRADIALHRCKVERAGCLIYDVQDESRAKQRIRIFDNLKKALRNGDFELFYQPQVELSSGRLFGAEALIRWTGENAMPPAEFIPLAEHTGLIAEITDWVITECVRQCSEWKESGMHIPVSFNLSAKNLHDASFVTLLVEQCEKYDLPTSLINVEITEHCIMENPERAIDEINNLRGMGFKVSIDDFGTGHSSLANLKMIPASELKIDQSFIFGLMTNKHDAILVKLIISLAKEFGMQLVAEGVETKETMERLREYGCNNIQGYYYSRPLPAKAFIEWTNHELPQWKH